MSRPSSPAAYPCWKFNCSYAGLVHVNTVTVNSYDSKTLICYRHILPLTLKTSLAPFCDDV